MNAAHLHALFFYFPLFFFTGALIADFLFYYRRLSSPRLGHWLVICGVLFCIPTLITGEAAAAQMHPADPAFLELHRHLGIASAISGSLYAGLRIACMIWKLPLRAAHFVFLSVMLVALLLWTIDYGLLLAT